MNRILHDPIAGDVTMATAVVQDGAFAWVVCAMSFLSQVVHGGLVFSMGMFFIMFRNGLDGGDGAITLITSLNYSVCFAVCEFCLFVFVFIGL